MKKLDRGNGKMLFETAYVFCKRYNMTEDDFLNFDLTDEQCREYRIFLKICVFSDIGKIISFWKSQ